MEKKELYDIIVIGAGGTGSFFSKELSRYLYKNDHKLCNLILVDGDTIEKKNMSRQAFMEEDVGQKKSVVLAEAYNAAFDLNWQAVGEYLTTQKSLKELISQQHYYNHKTIIVGCVDNHACRLLCEKVFLSERKDIFYLDSANEFSSGEVVFARKEDNKVLSPVRSQIFPDVLKGDLRNVTELSCEELNNASPQHIAVNMLAGNILLSEVCNILEGDPHDGFVVFDAKTFSVEYFPMAASDTIGVAA